MSNEKSMSETLNRISNKMIEIVTIIFNELENEEDKKEIIRKWEELLKKRNKKKVIELNWNFEEWFNHNKKLAQEFKERIFNKDNERQLTERTTNE